MSKIVKRKTEKISEKQKRNVVVRIVGTEKVLETDGFSKEFLDDPYINSYDGLANIVQPPYDLDILASMWEKSTELGQCLEAMAVNIEGFGHFFKTTIDLDENSSDELRDEVEEEKLNLENLFDNISLNGESMTKIRLKTRWDIECTGNGYWEIIPALLNKEESIERHGLPEVPAAINHIASYTMRLTKADEKAIKVKTLQTYRKKDGSTYTKTVTLKRRFRKYVHKRNNRDVWFKEYGDPRRLSYKTGLYETKDRKVNNDDLANPMIHFSLYSGDRTPYGIPRWIGQLFSILGSRSSDEINYKTLKNNNIPSMVVMVANGMLTDGSIERMREFVDEQIVGSGNYSKFLIVEAEPTDIDGMMNPGTMKLDIKPLKENQHVDQLFQEYDKNNLAKIRRSLRLTPIFVGRADEYTHATAEVARRITYEQVFTPARQDIDHIINTKIMVNLNIKYHKFVSNSANTTDNSELARILSTAEKTGGLTPNIARNVMSEIFGVDLGKIPLDKFDGDIPFTLTIAEAVKKYSGDNVMDQGRLNQEAIPPPKSRNKLPENSGDLSSETDSDLSTEKSVTELSFMSEIKGMLEKEINKRWEEKWGEAYEKNKITAKRLKRKRI